MCVCVRDNAKLKIHKYLCLVAVLVVFRIVLLFVVTTIFVFCQLFAVTYFEFTVVVPVRVCGLL